MVPVKAAREVSGGASPAEGNLTGSSARVVSSPLLAAAAAAAGGSSLKQLFKQAGGSDLLGKP